MAVADNYDPAEDPASPKSPKVLLGLGHAAEESLSFFSILSKVTKRWASQFVGTSKPIISSPGTLRLCSVIAVTNATHVSAPASGLRCLRSNDIFRMLTTLFLRLMTATMLRVRSCSIEIQKQHGSPALFGSYHSTVIRYTITF
jgi:hypothetical protein